MSLEPGGYADKLGNRYEGRWVVRQLLFLLAERVRSVTLETVGDEENGIDLLVESIDGISEAQQCKIGNRSKSDWSIKNLRTRNVLGYAKASLTSDPRSRFSLVSSVPAVAVNALADSARNSSGDSEDFYKFQVTAISSDRRRDFKEFCIAIDLNSDSVHDRQTAFNLLRQWHFHLFSDDLETRRDLECLASMLVAGEPSLVIACLADFAADNLRRQITTSDIVSHLTKSKFTVQQLILDKRVSLRISALNAEFIDSIEPKLAGGKLIERKETVQLLKCIDTPTPPLAVMLHGSPGSGKSGVLYELMRRLEELDTAAISIRLDRITFRSNASQFGEELGLPGSPVLCLSEISKTRKAVLVIDQLDALRWTNSHAHEGLKICNELLRQARSLRAQGRIFSIVFACRTFDLDHDPVLKDFLAQPQDSRIEKVEVHELAADVVTATAAKLGVVPERLSKRRVSLLQSVQRLAMWIEIVRSEKRTPEFDSATGLMREFWTNRCRELELKGISPDDRDSTVDRLVHHMEMNGSLNAPIHLINNEKLRTELQSLGVITIGRSVVAFAHQSYLDYFIANRALKSWDRTDQFIRDWIGGPEKQSLFRREQLKQVLFLLADEEYSTFLRIVNSLLNDPTIRFHLKLLVLETIGQLRPEPALLAMSVDLMKNDSWREHILFNVFWKNLENVEALAANGILQSWLANGQERDENTALWLLGSISEFRPQLAVKLCEPFVSRSEFWTRRIHDWLMRLNPSEEPACVFALRLRCMQNGQHPIYMPWKDFATSHPARALRLFTLSLNHWLNHPDDKRSSDTLKMDSPGDVAALEDAARHFPHLTWNLLAPAFVKCAVVRLKGLQRDRISKEREFAFSKECKRLPRLPFRILRSALQSLAGNRPNEFSKLANQLSAIPSKPLQQLLVDSYSCLAPEYADSVVEWILTDVRRLSCGSGRHEPSWMPARRLIERMSPYCSPEVFSKLESCLLKYRDATEKRLASFWISETRRGSFRNRFGGAQHFLLPGLSKERRSLETVSRIGVLKEKFGKSRQQFLRFPRIRGGWHRSPVNLKRIDHLSDRAWISIINNNKIQKSPRTRYFRSSVVETSVESMSRAFGTAAKRFPERFGRLALRIPATAPPEYFAAVLDAVGAMNPPSDVPTEQRTTWMFASKETVDGVLNRMHVDLSNDDVAKQFCWCVINRDDADCTPLVIRRLRDCAIHSDPPPDVLWAGGGNASNCSLHDLENNAINSVRAVAAHAISKVLFRNPRFLNDFKLEIESLWNDAHAAVKVASVEICLPIWNQDKALSITGLLQACKNDARIAACRSAAELYNFAFARFSSVLIPILQSMIVSPDDEVAKNGASQVAARHLFHQICEAEFQTCKSGCPSLRRGVAKVLARLSHDPAQWKSCRPHLIDLLNDTEKEVREKAYIYFSEDDLSTHPEIGDVLNVFVNSLAFRDDPVHLLFAFERFKGSLLPFADVISQICGQFVAVCTDKAESGTSKFGHTVDHVTSLLLRLYEESGRARSTEIRQRCLDAWDSLLKAGVGSALALTRALDK